MLVQKDYKFWFCTGSQDLYGDECLAHVAEHSQIIVKALNESGILPYEVVWKPTPVSYTHLDVYKRQVYMVSQVQIGACTRFCIW